VAGLKEKVTAKCTPATEDGVNMTTVQPSGSGSTTTDQIAAFFAVCLALTVILTGQK